jgi:hypothetical protein
MEADMARRKREDMTEANYDAFHLRHDFTHKTAGQSKEVLSKVRMSVQQTSSFFQQALSDITKWFKVGMRNSSTPIDAMLIKPSEAEKMLQFQLTQAGYYRHVGLSVQRALLGGLMLSKPHGKLVPKPKFKLKTDGKGKNLKKSVVAVDDKTWELAFKRVRNDDFYPDPSGDEMYCIEKLELDMHEVIARSKGEDAIYDSAKVFEISKTDHEDALDQYEKNRETDQIYDYETGSHRMKVQIEEFWGNIVGEDGDLLYENCVFTVANGTTVIRRPTPNPMWHQLKPFITTALLEVDGAVWPMALMDAAVKHNHTMVEMLNLILDAAFKKVHSPMQIRVQDLANPEQVSDGIKPGVGLKVKSSLPVGAKVLEALTTVDVPNDALNVLNLIQQEYNGSALTTDLRSGVLPDRAVKATEVVEQSQTITSVFQGISKNIEANQIVKELTMSWMLIAQNWDQIALDVFISIFGEARGTELSQLDPQDVFVQTVNGYKFEVMGITQTLAKAQDFRKLTTMLQTISSSELLIEEFIQKYDMGKLLGEIMESLNIDTHKIEHEEQEVVQPNDVGMNPNGDMSQVPAAPAPGGFASAMGAQPPGLATNFDQ